MEEPKKISEVCRMLDMTSRTIRYYEQCRLIKTIRESKSSPRRIDAENIGRLRKIRFLRKLGLSLEEIAVIIDNEAKAAEIIYGKTADYADEINTLKKRIKFLEDVVTTVKKGGDIYSVDSNENKTKEDAEKLRIASEITDLMIERKFSEILKYGDDLLNKLTPELIESVWDRMLLANGKVVSVGEQQIDGNIVATKINFEKRSVDFKVNISVGVVTGLIFQSINI